MENVIFTLAYILLLIWAMAILISAATTIWSMTGLNINVRLNNFGKVYTNFINWFKAVNHKKSNVSYFKRVIHN